MVLVLAGATTLAQEAAQPPPREEQAGPAEVAYQVAIQGDLSDSLRALLHELSDSVRLIERPPASLARLRRRAQDDIPRLLEALRSRAYYDAKVDLDLQTERTPVLVRFRIDQGPVYRLNEIAIEFAERPAELRVPAPRELGLEPGEPAYAQEVLDAQRALLRRVQAQGFPLATLGQYRAVVDHDTRTMDLTLRIEPGLRGRFGPVQIQGLATIEEDFVRRRLPWEEGELITPERLALGRESLVVTQLFSTARLRLLREPDAAGRLPVTVEVTERMHRSIGVGARYRTDEGPGGNITWEHRNLFGRGERLEAEFDGSAIGYRLSGDFRKPDFLARDQALIASSGIAFEDTDAYEHQTIGAFVGLERRLGRDVTASLGVAFRAVDIEAAAEDESERFGLLSLPATLDWDASDDPFNPTRGGRLTLRNEPFADVFGNHVIFNRTRISYTHYFEVVEEPAIVLAGRAALGTMFGANRAEIPADERFYAGGGDSVRGFGFQLAGPLDGDGDPLGGRSLLELSGEVRAQFTETIGAAAFVDAGSVFERQYPDFEDELHVGVGVGLRYFSPFLPIRLDVGFPLNRRDVDDAYQIYISFGQAF